MKPIITLIICFAIPYLFLYDYFQMANYRDPTSFFFDRSRAYQRRYTLTRTKQADAFIDASYKSPSHPPPLQPPTICIGVPTVARNGHEQYAQWTIGSLLDGLSSEERQNIYLSLFIAQSNPSIHPTFHEEWAHTLPDQLLTYRKNLDVNISEIQTWEENNLYRIKTIFDYTYTLQDCYDTGAHYIAVVEGDVLFVKGWYERMVLALGEIEDAMARRPQQKWIYLRLFYTERLLGWNSQFWPTYLFWSTVTFLILNFSLFTARAHIRKLQPTLTNPIIALLSCGFLPACIILFFLAGKNSVMHLSPGIHEMNSFGCCSQGLVFPRNMLPGLIQKMPNALSFNYLADSMIETISDQEEYIRWAITPALLQHIGKESSKGTDFNNGAARNWNFEFELYGDSKLP
ncbi:hypothetical protein F5884DRAFT_820465 [Xylogone sp. PMI_703]|nr:hypothetical protein F5884DRAFT_820465 [Xylogone sp. PMI_703]